MFINVVYICLVFVKYVLMYILVFFIKILKVIIFYIGWF